MYEKFVALAENEELVKEVFSGTNEEILAKLSEQGIDMTAEELEEVIRAAKSVGTDGSAELDENALRDVAGGCKWCTAVGYILGKVIRYLL